jgi:hypothetical protein
VSKLSGTTTDIPDDILTWLLAQRVVLRQQLTDAYNALDKARQAHDALQSSYGGVVRLLREYDSEHARTKRQRIQEFAETFRPEGDPQ